MLKVINVVGARPNFMKVAPIVAAMKKRPAGFQPLVVHTGQHYDAAMSDSFFHDLELPQPDTHLALAPVHTRRKRLPSWSASSRLCFASSRIGFWLSATSIQPSRAHWYV
jgi:hypothetical protein